MTAKFDLFKRALDELCQEHEVVLAGSIEVHDDEGERPRVDLLTDRTTGPKLVRIPDVRDTDLATGDYVFASRWGDADPGDPWCVGFVERRTDDYITVAGSNRAWKKAMRISHAVGARICAEMPALGGTRNPEALMAVAPGGADSPQWPHRSARSMGLEVDQAKVRRAADYCDELVVDSLLKEYLETLDVELGYHWNGVMMSEREMAKDYLEPFTAWLAQRTTDQPATPL